MDTFANDFPTIAVGLVVSFAGIIAFLISLLRLKTKDFTLLHIGAFGFLCGLRMLSETATMRALVPSFFPYFHTYLTYLFVIPWAGFLVEMFGDGKYKSMVWVFRTTILYAVGAIGYDLLIRGAVPDAAISRPLVLAWGAIWIVNVLFPQRPRDIELRTLQAVFLITLIFVVIDQLKSIGVLSWSVSLQAPGYGVLFIGLGFVGIHHFIFNDRKLQSIEKEIELARRIQRSNLPDNLQSPPGIDIAARYVPMSTVAGDFYDIHVDGGGGIGILIADVSGHGVGAALIGSMLKIAFASQAEGIADPARVLSAINRILRGKIEESFVTACCVYIDPKRRILKYSSAGHPSPLLVKTSTGRLLRLSESGLMLGPFPDAQYKNETIRVSRGDRLLLYTDGIVETRNRQGEFYGEERLERLLVERREAAGEESVDRVVQEVLRWRGKGSSLDDDLTLMIVDLAGPRAKGS